MYAVSIFDAVDKSKLSQCLERIAAVFEVTIKCHQLVGISSRLQPHPLHRQRALHPIFPSDGLIVRSSVNFEGSKLYFELTIRRIIN